MKYIKYSGSIILVILIFAFAADACTITISPLRRKYRRAESVFVAKVLSVVNYSPSEKEISLISKNWRDWDIFSKVTFEIRKKWKGAIPAQPEYIAVAYYDCGCPGDFDEFKAGNEYLVFASKKKFLTVCDSEQTNRNDVDDEIKKLDGFWFRSWAAVYPF